jgi:cytochrome c
MKTLVRLFCVLFGLAFAAGSASAQDYATAAEAEALVKKAVALYKAEGKDKAFAAFQDANGGFQVKDLYIFVQDLKGLTLVHKNPGLIGKDASGMKDAEGKMFMAEMVKVANEKGSGWVDYMWVNPTTKKIQAKSTYLERSGDVFLGAGIYK